MCGIVAYVGLRPAAPLVFHALGLLEYRGYDSAGIAVLTPDGEIETEKTVGGVVALTSLLVRADLQTSGTAIGHTRWATHGAVTEVNAHPLSDCHGAVSIAHNGVIANADVLRRELAARGHRLVGEVDSEVIAHLVEEFVEEGSSIAVALTSATARLEGSWAIVAMDARTGTVAATAQGSPLIVSTTPEGTFVASDITAISDRVDAYQVLRSSDVVEIGRGGATWWDGGARSAGPSSSPVRWRATAEHGGRFDDHMGNEIDEQPAVAARVLDAFAGGIADGSLWRSLGLAGFDRIHRVVVLGCGTSLHAGIAIGRVFSDLGHLPVTALVASEASSFVPEPHTLVIAISQSGETADILRALDALSFPDRTLLALTNNPYSSLAREADAVIDCLAGVEIGVAATKTFVAQVMTGVAVALSGLCGSARVDRVDARAALEALTETPLRLDAALRGWSDSIPLLTEEFADASGFLFLGRGSGVVYAAEGALKLKELTYRWAEHQPAGELKHGPLALVENGTPVLAVDVGDRRLDINIAEVLARGGRVVRIAGVGPDPVGDLRPAPPWGPLEAVVPLQLFARSLAIRLDRNVDKPRNLAKSVTVD
ncbi:glutamine--fructose-6-phosphate transaminase (isomerizing) [Microbacterium hatanonis]|uniref:Glutamine--fructose-6-phosphate aminotransferase [isomerizing] n=1 Tax=Microbacterium hatanonis TaxID=404366 RepID=A0A5C8I5J6_9MICO|nr:glutamine--fructose-6-phosphate transaminase (isomerizing) [Microbacterium hatanonis]TXK13185.1 glutamine--fructose-6-phosphate transaminase (isomerizing) [Microbacterium hatanonis]